MANFEIPENPKYTEEIRKFDITDPAHAELFNRVIQALINNETFLKKIQEKHADDTEEQFQQQYEQLTGYTDTRIGQLINGAPETLDTIKEIADAILENETVIEALNEAIGKKLNKDGDISDTTVAFTSEDNESPTVWKDIGRIVSGKVKEILNRVSIMSNNLKYLYKLCGTTDVSKIADGTLTGAVSMLNTDIQYKYIGNEITLTENIYLDAYVENGMVIIRSIVPKSLSVGLKELMRVPEKYAPRAIFFGYVSYNSSSDDINKVSSVLITGEGSVKAWLLSKLTYDEPFTIMYPLKRI